MNKQTVQSNTEQPYDVILMQGGGNQYQMKTRGNHHYDVAIQMWIERLEYNLDRATTQIAMLQVEIENLKAAKPTEMEV